MASKTQPRDRLISDTEAAELLGVSPTTVRRMRNAEGGVFPTIKVRQRSMLRESDVLAFIASGGGA